MNSDDYYHLAVDFVNIILITAVTCKTNQIKTLKRRTLTRFLQLITRVK